ncbi:creatininase family protein [Actinoplanes sp. L3-i22]|uniref:creatininase family protein n=1 Tax=Actinoplanes sp. L3-i22 TaxID=2836373 RepID=UPI001C778CE7|nr:creatininase family protein [Actinoplanes sp. L3-i22]BCY11060.1 creatinine amidohydrolase [Actinoplanes sp. L3-i22]
MDLIPSTTSANVRRDAPSVAVLPVGSFEQHGDYMPLATDTIVASAIAASVAARYNALLLPAVPLSCSHEHSGWPGTVSISHHTLAYLVTDVAQSLERQGISRLVIINGHGGNYVLSNVAQVANADKSSSMSLFPSRNDWDSARRLAGLESNAHEDMHAGELEVSILLSCRPDAVDDGALAADHSANERPFLPVHGMGAYTKSGVIGRPSLANAIKGDALLRSLTDAFAYHLQALGVTDATRS